MAELLERVKLSNLVYGDGIVENYKNNSIYFYNKYSKSDDEVQSIQVGDIQIGRFYFLHYKDDSNWVKYSPVFTIGFKKFENLIILMAINFNLIPLEVRVSFFDNFILEEDFEQDRALKVDFNGAYKELIKYGFEYAIMEYNVAQVILSHRINMSAVPRFLYAGHPINIYDPRKLYDIWKVKLNTKYQRDQEMSKSLIKDFYQISDDINENYKILKNHIQRLQTSINKYGRPS
jgi:hypothetical protein